METKIKNLVAKVGGIKILSFFPRVATSHKRYNSIESLLVDGCSTYDPSVIKETIKKLLPKFVHGFERVEA